LNGDRKEGKGEGRGLSVIIGPNLSSEGKREKIVRSSGEATIFSHKKREQKLGRRGAEENEGAVFFER